MSTDPDDPLWSNVHKMADHRPTTPLTLRAARLPSPSTIPPRQWLYGTQLLRGFVTVLIAPGGTGKSAYAMAMALALVLGRQLFKAHIFARCNACIINLEDPLDELDRRLAALMLKYDVDETEVRGRLFMHSGEDRAVTMAAVSDDGFTVVHPDEQALIAEINAHNIGALIVDPFAESHTLEENSNPQMVQASAAWRRVARATNCAVLLLHHVRKGAAADIDAARGAKSLTDSARVGLLLSPMSDLEGEDLGVPPKDRHAYVRLDNAKANMAPRAGTAEWFQLEQIPLGNGTQDYAHGDTVAAVVAWNPPNPLGGVPTADLNRVLDAIAAGPEPGRLYTPTRRSPARWVGVPIMAMLSLTEGQARNIVAIWTRNQLLVIQKVDDGNNRLTDGITVNDAKRPTE